MKHKIVTENETELINKLIELIENVSNTSIKEKDSFYIGFSGGSLVKFLTIGLPKIKTDFSKWTVFFCDERVVPENSPDSTYGVYKKELLPYVDLKEEQFIRLKQGVTAKEAAEDYREQLSKLFTSKALPRFDMLLLGMGPDGHTCSLFPAHELQDETKLWVASITDSPKPPPSRITLTFPVINNAKYCVFALSGEGKAEMVKRILVQNEDLPAGRVNPTNGELYWFLDKAAGKYL